MFGIFEPPHRRVRDEREIRYFFSQYGDEAPDILQERASNHSLSARDRRHWRRLARKARRRQDTSTGALKTS